MDEYGLCARPCGYCLKASMTGRGGVVGDFRFLALLGMTQWQGFVVFTLTFDSSPIKGEGDSVGWFVLLYAPPFGYCLESKMTRHGRSRC